MPDMFVVIWAAVTVMALVIESLTTMAVSVWFAPAGLVALILATLGVEPIWQIVVFAALSLIGIVLFFGILKKKLHPAGNKLTGTDLLIGKTARVTSEINNTLETGEVRTDGKVWAARMENDAETATEGELVSIVSISGVKLICKKK